LNVANRQSREKAKIVLGTHEKWKSQPRQETQPLKGVMTGSTKSRQLKKKKTTMKPQNATKGGSSEPQKKCATGGTLKEKKARGGDKGRSFCKVSNST